MRINVHSEGFQLTPQLRGVVVSRMVSALGSFGAYIDVVVVRLQATRGHTQPETTICDVAVSLRPSGDVQARAEDAQMRVAIDRASDLVRGAVEREVSRSHPVPGGPSRVEEGTDASALEIVLDGNRISQHQREMLERPENYLRPIRIRDYWRSPDLEDDELPEELEAVVSTR